MISTFSGYGRYDAPYKPTAISDMRQTEVTGYTTKLPIPIRSPVVPDSLLPSGIDGIGGGQSGSADIAFIVGLWNYCKGQKNGNTYSVQNCSISHSNFWFNPAEALGLSSTDVDRLFPSKVQAVLQTSREVSRWMISAYILSLVTNLMVLFAGVFAVFTQLGSMASIICSGVSYPLYYRTRIDLF
jgi:hypothetical protein